MTSTLQARVLSPGSSGAIEIRPTRLTFDQGAIIALEPLATDAGLDLPDIVVPGFVDLQMNGSDDLDLWTIVEEADLDSWSRVEDSLLDQGVTTWCPTFVSAPRHRYESLSTFLHHLERRPPSGPRPAIPGIHLEGPFLGSAIGAHSPPAIAAPDLEWLAALSTSLTGRLALVTMGAESDLAASACRQLFRLGVRVSLGHTRASREQYAAMRTAGASMVTHLFNGMGGIDHRRPGLAAWALTDDDVWCGLIADGVHVDPSWIGVAFRSKPDHMILVTDRVAQHRPGMMSDGRSVRRDDGTLAGSLLTMAGAVRNCVELAGVSLARAVAAATANPARAMNWTDRGLIAVGRRADLVALDDRHEVSAVWLDGRRIR